MRILVSRDTQYVPDQPEEKFRFFRAAEIKSKDRDENEIPFIFGISKIPTYRVYTEGHQIIVLCDNF